MGENNAKILKTVKGKPMVLFGGFLYTLNRQLSDKSYWVCRKRGECKARLHTTAAVDENSAVQVLQEVGSHTHMADPVQVGVVEAKLRIISQAVETNDSGHKILLNASCTVTDAVAANLPSSSTLKRDIRRIRQKKNHPHPLPTSRAEVTVPDEFQVTCKGQQFLLHDSGSNDRTRLLIFATQANIEILKKSEIWFVDGTFKVVPSLFYQLYTIHALFNDAVVPLVYALLPDKKQTTYSRVLSVLTPYLAGAQPERVVMDFEKATMNAFQEAFPDAILQGCLFHLAQSVLRHVQSSGLQVLYNTDQEFSLQMRMLPALAFLPEDDVVEAFDDLLDTLPSYGVPIAEYFEDTYIGRQRRGGRATPMFPISFWSAYERVLEGLPRTNNNMEGWHRSLQSNVECSKPTIFKFLSAIVKEQSLTEMKIARVAAGHLVDPRKLKYEALNERVFRVVCRYDGRGSKLQFLRNLAYSFER